MACLPPAVDPCARATSASAPAPDPLALPSSTSSQFVLLAVAVVAVAMYTADQAVGLALGSSANWAGRYRQCDLVADRPTLRSAVQVTTDHAACLDGVTHLRAAVSATVVAAVLVVLLLAHWVYPWVIARRDLLCPIDPVTYPAAHAQIDAVLAQAAATGEHNRPVEILVAPLREDPAGRVIGRAGRYTVRLNRGLVRHGSAGGLADLRAVLRHELAHVHHGDAVLTSVAVHSTWALAAVAVPSLALAAWTARAGFAIPAARWAVVLVAVVLVRASVIRTREHYADLRAARTNVAAGDEAFRVSAFSGPTPAPDVAPGPRGGGRTLAERCRLLFVRLCRPLLVHPATQTRQDLVLQPDRLLTAGFVEAFATGLVSGLLLPQFVAVLDAALTWNDYGTYAACIGVALLCTTVVGSSLWRATLRAHALGLPLPSGVRPGAGLALGLLAGQLLCPTGGVSWTALVRADLPGSAVCAAVLMAACLVFTRWCVEAASCSTAPGARFPAVAGRRAATVIGTLLWASLLQLWLSAIGQHPPWSALGDAALMLLFDPGRSLPVLLAAAFLAAARRPCPRSVLAAAPAGLVLATLVLVTAVVLALVAMGPTEVVERLNSARLSGSAALLPAAATFLMVPAALVVLVVEVVAGTVRGWVRAARAVVVAVLFVSCPLAPVMLVVPLVPVACDQGLFLVCPSPLLVVQGLGTAVDAAVGSAIASAAVVTPPLALLGAVLDRRRRRRPHPPRPASFPRRAVRARPARFMRLGRVIRLASAGLTAAASVCAIIALSAFWFGLTDLMPVGPLAAFTGTGPQPTSPLAAGSVTVPQACARLTDDRQRLTDDTQDAQSAARLLATNSAALRAFGRTVEEAIRAGDLGQKSLGWRSAWGYCARHA